MKEKIQRIYDKIKHRYKDKENTEKERLLLKTELLYELGELFEVKCDEENNTPDILNYGCFVAEVSWDKEYGTYKYINLVFGNEKNIGIVNQLLTNKL